MQLNSQLDELHPFKKPRINQEIPCKQFQRGKCDFGQNRRYSRTPFNNLASNRTKTTMDEVGPLDSKVRLCRWSSGKDCPFGESCHFVHNGRSSDGVVLSGCFTKRNFEEHENQRNGYKNLFWKTKLCNKWMTFNRCAYGERCQYAHGHLDLKAFGSGMNVFASSVNATSGKTVKKTVYGSCTKTWKKTGIRAAYKKGEQGKWIFKWTDVEKISRIYADWID